MECHVEGTRQQIAGVVDQPVDVPRRDHHVGAILGNAFAVDALHGGVEVYHSGGHLKKYGQKSILSTHYFFERSIASITAFLKLFSSKALTP